ncbi:MAG: low temperature requirement protein A [Acidimicrobiia bacterium]
MTEQPQASSTLDQFRRYFWQPPRAHGDVIEDRSVTFLELFYDLVYVVVIAQAAHHLAEHVSWRGAAEFAVVFGLIWIAWLNGTLYHDLHGRTDGRTRTFVAVQMGLLALLGVFTSGATGVDGPAFAVVYTAYLLVLTWLWYTVQRQDDERFLPFTHRFLFGMVVSVVVIGASAFLDDDARIVVWALFVTGWLVGIVVLQAITGGMARLGFDISDSLVERFGLFTIIVLGEVVVGVVAGMSDGDRSAIAIATGMLGLAIGFAYWWTYFDFVGGRRVTMSNRAHTTWMIGHFPITLGIAATGAAMVSLVHHAEDSSTPQPTAWLLTGSIAVALVALALVTTALLDSRRLPQVFGPLRWAMALSALVALGFGWLRPAPWILALSLWVVLSILWFYAILRWVKCTDPEERVPTLADG